ncbi:hypothetical protein T07_6723 [Trichinella nelsoni]|uniref:Uncharacterized protein n=1 Tax=Trichinella nelsoni TaxID=6336 RepID=A0A0V0SDT3_9BILA|nr:hypothetical protein T07_6723 [Trichinella nelsoni]
MNYLHDAREMQHYRPTFLNLIGLYWANFPYDSSPVLKLFNVNSALSKFAKGCDRHYSNFLQISFLIE